MRQERVECKIQCTINEYRFFDIISYLRDNKEYITKHLKPSHLRNNHKKENQKHQHQHKKTQKQKQKQNSNKVNKTQFGHEKES